MKYKYTNILLVLGFICHLLWQHGTFYSSNHEHNILYAESNSEICVNHLPIDLTNNHTCTLFNKCSDRNCCNFVVKGKYKLIKQKVLINFSSAFVKSKNPKLKLYDIYAVNFFDNPLSPLSTVVLII